MAREMMEALIAKDDEEYIKLNIQQKAEGQAPTKPNVFRGGIRIKGSSTEEGLDLCATVKLPMCTTPRAS